MFKLGAINVFLVPIRDTYLAIIKVILVFSKNTNASFIQNTNILFLI